MSETATVLVGAAAAVGALVAASTVAVVAATGATGLSEPPRRTRNTPTIAATATTAPTVMMAALLALGAGEASGTCMGPVLGALETGVPKRPPSGKSVGASSGGFGAGTLSASAFRLIIPESSLMGPLEPAVLARGSETRAVSALRENSIELSSATALEPPMDERAAGGTGVAPFCKGAAAAATRDGEKRSLVRFAGSRRMAARGSGSAAAAIMDAIGDAAAAAGAAANGVAAMGAGSGSAMGTSDRLVTTPPSGPSLSAAVSASTCPSGSQSPMPSVQTVRLCIDHRRFVRCDDVVDGHRALVPIGHVDHVGSGRVDHARCRGGRRVGTGCAQHNAGAVHKNRRTALAALDLDGFPLDLIVGNRVLRLARLARDLHGMLTRYVGHLGARPWAVYLDSNSEGVIPNAFCTRSLPERRRKCGGAAGANWSQGGVREASLGPRSSTSGAWAPTCMRFPDRPMSGQSFVSAVVSDGRGVRAWRTMSPTDLLSEVDRILEESKTALLATVGVDGRARLRWMTPRRIKVRPGYLYCASEAETVKVDHVRHNPNVTWTIQRATLNEVIALRGHAVVLDEPGLLQEFLEAVGKDLFMVWRLHPLQSTPTTGTRSPRPHLVVIETAIEEAERLDCLSGKTTRYAFTG